MERRDDDAALWPTALSLAMAATLEVLLSDNAELKGKVIARLEQLSEVATEGQEDFADALTWLRRIGN